MSTAIEFENISKQYRLGLVSTGTLSHDLNRFWQTKILRREDPYLKVGETNDRAHKGSSEYVWALKDINFKVEQGDVIGIIGRNGAGKSTLLKLLSRVTAPTTGTIRAKGRIASLLEVGTGFHPEMTGRENIYMNGAIMGMTRAEITRKLDEIVDFSGCERYLDTPVKRYSSGMTVRLGFAIAAHLEPEILVVDEVLAVGDAEFQKKAIGKMQDVSRGEGRTVLFVSHNMGAVKNLCKRGIVLDQGQISYISDIDSSITHYLNKAHKVEPFESIANITREKGYNTEILFTNLKFLDSNDNEIQPYCGKFLKIRIFFKSLSDIKKGRFSLAIRDILDKTLLSFPSDLTIPEIVLNKGESYADLVIEKFPLTAGDYKIALHASNSGIACDYLESAKKFTVIDGDFFGSALPIPNYLSGKIVLCNHKWIIPK
jgi:lipopolysaccharide transport system ATP-binding protein